MFQKVQELIASRRRRQKNGTTQIFSGLVKCADCGWSLAYGVNSQNKNPYAHYHCSKYGQGLRQCSMHYIRYDVLYAYVLARLQYWSMLAQKDEDKLLKRLLNASDRERNSAKKKQAAELKKAEKRKAEVDGLFAKMYEDWSAGRITEYNFNMLWNYGNTVPYLLIAGYRKDVEKCIQLIKRLLSESQKPWNMTQSPLYYRYEDTAQGKAFSGLGKNFVRELYSEIENKKEYEFLRGNKKLESIFEEHLK